ncbi:HPr family phosphocarrier protein [Luteococcus sp. H138]|uniref:HPr family phosphocarrier protein n=1 Tax=unclassified Luteococcus TaxID=2639923 RepID=UPI00313E9297
MQQRRVTVTVPGGVHARIATQLARIAAAHVSSVFLLAPRAVSLARTIDLLALGLTEGSEVTVVTDGRDEVAALAAVVAVLCPEA